MPRGQVKIEQNANSLVDKVKGRGKKSSRNDMTAEALAMASYVSKQDGTADNIAESYDENDAAQKFFKARAKRITDDLDSLLYGSGAGGYDETLGDMSINGDMMDTEIARDDMTQSKGGFKYWFKHLFYDKDIQNVMALGARFDETRTTENTQYIKRKDVYTTDLMMPVPGVVVDARSIRLVGKYFKSPADQGRTEIYMPVGGKKPRLAVFTGATRALADYDVTAFGIEKATKDSPARTVIRAEGTGGAGAGASGALREKLSPHLTRSLTFSEIAIDSQILAGGRPKVAFEDAKVQYTDDVAGSAINGVTLDNVNATLQNGQGVVVLDSLGADTATIEKTAMDADAAVLAQPPAPAAPAPAEAAPTLKSISVNTGKSKEELEAEKKAKKEQEERNDYHEMAMDPLQNIPAIGKVKGLGGEIDVSETGRYKAELTFKAKGSYYDYVQRGVTRYDKDGKKYVEDIRKGDDFDNFFDFLLGNPSVKAQESAANRLNAIKALRKEKLAQGEEISDEDMAVLVEDALGTTLGEDFLSSISNSVLGENVTRFWTVFMNKHKLENAGLYKSSISADLLEEFIGERQIQVFKTIASGFKKDSTPLNQRLSEYWEALGKGKELSGTESIPGIPMPIDEDAVAKAEKDRKKSGAISVRSAVLPYVVAEFSYKPYINFSPIGDLKIEPLEDAKTIEEARAEFKEKALAKGVTADELRAGVLDEDFKAAYSNIKYSIQPSFGVKASAGCEISASLLAGGGMILAVKGTVFGQAGGEVGISANAEFIMEYGDNGVKWSDTVAKAGISGDIKLSGSVGIKAGIASELFDWEYNVFKFNALSLSLGPFSWGGKMNLGSTNDGSIPRFSSEAKAEFSAAHLPKLFKGGSSDSGFKYEPQELPSGMQAMVDEARAYVGQFDALRDKVSTIMKIIKNPANAHLAREGTESFTALREVLANLAIQLREKNTQFVDTIEGLKTMVEGMKADKTYKKKSKKIADRIQKHQDRIDRLNPATAPAGFDPDDVLDFYEDGITRTQGKGDYEKYQKKKMTSKKLQEIGLSDVATASGGTEKKYKQMLKAKLDEVIENKRALIEQIRNYPVGANAGETFGEFYKRIAPRSKVYEHLGVADTLTRQITDSNGNTVDETPLMRLREFEKKRLEKATAGETSNVEKIKAYLAKHKIDKRIPNKEFSTWYFDTLGAGTWLSLQTVDYLTPKVMMAAMQRALRTSYNESTSGEYSFERLRILEQFKARHTAALEKVKKATTDPERDAARTEAANIETEARAAFFVNEKVKENYRNKFYRTSTIDDLISYESSWNEAGQEDKWGVFAHHEDERNQRDRRAALLSVIKSKIGQLDDAGITNLNVAQKAELRTAIGANEDAMAEMHNLGIVDSTTNAKGEKLTSEAGAIDLSKIGFWKDRKYGGLSRFFGRIGDTLKLMAAGATSHVGMRRQVIMENVSFDTILDYERTRAAEYDPGDKNAVRHNAILAYLKARRALILAEKDPKKQKALVKAEREQYFSGILDEKLGFGGWKSKDHSEIISRIESGVINDYRVSAAILEKDQVSYQDQHTQRLAQLKKLKAENPDMSALEAYYIYNNDIRDYSAIRRLIPIGTRGFEDWMKSEEQKKVGAAGDICDIATIDQMIRFQKRKLSRNTRSHTMRAGYLGTQAVDRGTSVIPILGNFDAFDTDKKKIEKSADIYQEGMYGLYEKMKVWYEKYEADAGKKSDMERQKEFSQKVRDNLLQGAFAKNWMFLNFLNNLPPIAALEYEAMRAGEKGAKYQERLDLIDKFEDRPDGSLSREERQRYLAAVRQDHFFKRNLTRDKNYQSAYDKELEERYEKGEYDLTKETAIEYQELRILELKREYLKMEAEMEAARVSETARAGSTADSIEEAQFKAFVKNGGEKIMLEDSEVKAAVDAELATGIDRSRDAITEFEESRIRYYEDLQAKLDMPANKISEIQKQYQADNIWIDMVLPQIEGARPEDIFNGDARFTESIDRMIDYKNPGEDPELRAAFSAVPLGSTLGNAGAPTLAAITDGSGGIDTRVIDEAEWTRQIEELKKIIGE